MFKKICLMGFLICSFTAHAGDTELGLVMKSIGSQLKVISSQALDEKMAAQNVELVEAFRKTVLESVVLHPEKEAAIIDPIEQKMFNLQYQSTILKLADETTQLEQAFLKFNAEAIQGSIDKIKQMKVDGHKLFK